MDYSEVCVFLTGSIHLRCHLLITALLMVQMGPSLRRQPQPESQSLLGVLDITQVGPLGYPSLCLFIGL